MDLLDGFLCSNFQVRYDAVLVCGCADSYFDTLQIDCWYSDVDDHQLRITEWPSKDEILCQSLLEIQVCRPCLFVGLVISTISHTHCTHQLCCYYCLRRCSRIS